MCIRDRDGIAHFINSSLNKSAIDQVRSDILSGNTMGFVHGIERNLHRFQKLHIPVSYTHLLLNAVVKVSNINVHNEIDKINIMNKTLLEGRLNNKWIICWRAFNFQRQINPTKLFSF